MRLFILIWKDVCKELSMLMVSLCWVYWDWMIFLNYVLDIFFCLNWIVNYFKCGVVVKLYICLFFNVFFYFCSLLRRFCFFIIWEVLKYNLRLRVKELKLCYYFYLLDYYILLWVSGYINLVLMFLYFFFCVIFWDVFFFVFVFLLS